MTSPQDRHTKRWIKPLPKQLINKIAAGEVVERPASVVKELVENSLDSGADRIEIAIEKAGIKSIKITDNGCGISEDQIEIAFSRHATSKIASFDDLEVLGSYGFRGEALPSIASVARLRMVSRPHDVASGIEIIYEGGVLQHKRPIAAAPGTTIEIENLFFNTPARRKFLKAESTELRQISRTATALAFGRPDVAMSYMSNGRSIYSEPSQDLSQRVPALLGRGKHFLKIEGELGPAALLGYIARPDNLQNNRYGQYLFINNRFIASPSLSHAISAGFAELIPRGSFPVGVLMLTIDPREIDVNVHPAKTEVRLSHEREVYDLVRRSVRDGLRHDGVIPDLDSPFSRSSRSGHGSPSILPNGRHSPSQSEIAIPGIGGSRMTKQDMSDLYRAPTQPLHSQDNVLQTATVTVDTRTGEIIENQPQRVGPSQGVDFIGRLSSLYLICRSGENLFIVDQHTAHERVLYEETMKKIDEHSVHGQNLLFPVQVELSPEQFALFEENHAAFSTGGFEVNAFGGRTVNIQAVPTVLGKKSPEKVFAKIIDDIVELRSEGYDVKKAMAQSIACRAAVMSGDRLSEQEATHLLERLMQCENPYSCPHGRPTFLRISKDELDKKFGRA